MKLLHIKPIQCPECDTGVIIEERIEADFGNRTIREHTMGGRWEHRKFLCGCTLSWSPNMRRLEVSTPCTRSANYQELETKRDKLRDKIKTLEKELRELNNKY